MIPASTRKYIDSLVDYYINEAASYKQIAKIYAEETGDVSSATFGIIVGSIYSAFLQTYDNQKLKPPVEDVQEFTQIIKRRATQIKKSIFDAKA